MEQPLISCIMPTKDRRAFVAQALYYFEQQDYPNKELIVVDDGDDMIVDLVSQRPYVRYIMTQYAHTVGVKRNIACEAARGDLICHWDDDDWYAPNRLSYQVAPMLTGQADITGLHLQHVLDLKRMQGWQCEDISSMQPGVDGMHYGTAIYRKQLWENRTRFHDSPKGDDGAGFVRRLINLGAQVYTLPCASHQVYVRHGNNIWKYRLGSSIGAEVWSQVGSEKCIPREDLRFYKAMSMELAHTKQPNPAAAAIKSRVGGLFTKKLAPFVFSSKR